ncbi:hypothetical protein C2G38_2048703 [Gigaspora rosea]|uniref:SWIM-type domain-containing protein n=1 Tax=Gigaspora rosea TaxID=44941 RepID=A0A397U5U2_9GLOM|nr:hypothetical protein C2G38_2048703 [Gigaspora rosea]
MALENCSGSVVIEIWEVRHIQSTTNHSQFVILLENGTHYCTCLYLIYAGFVCQHFFAVMIQSKKALFNIKLIPSRWYSEKSITSYDGDQELSIQIVQSNIKSLPTGTFEVLERICGQEVNSRIAVESDSRKVFYGRGLGLCKKALNIAITNGSNTVLEDILHQFINEQTSAQSNNNSASDLSEQGTCQEIDSFKISNPSQHKGRGRPANKRYLSAIENYDNKRVCSDNNVDISKSGLKKKNKRQCAMCKSWYHDSRNCPSKE